MILPCCRPLCFMHACVRAHTYTRCAGSTTTKKDMHAFIERTPAPTKSITPIAYGTIQSVNAITKRANTNQICTRKNSTSQPHPNLTNIFIRANTKQIQSRYPHIQYEKFSFENRPKMTPSTSFKALGWDLHGHLLGCVPIVRGEEQCGGG